MVALVMYWHQASSAAYPEVQGLQLWFDTFDKAMCVT